MEKRILTRISSRAAVLFLMLLAALVNIGPALAASDTGLRDASMAPITPVAYVAKVAMAEPLGDSPHRNSLETAILRNMRFLPFVNIIDPDSVPGGSKVAAVSGPDLDLQRFRMVRTDNLLTFRWLSPTQVEIRMYEVETGRFMLGTKMDLGSGASIEDVADEFCAQFMEALTGRGDFFRSTLAFVKSAGPRHKNVWTVKPTGRNLRQVTNMPGDALSPAWSHDGRFIVFSHIDARTHALGVWDSLTNRVQRIRFPGNTVIGPCFMPDNKVAVSLTDGQNPSIFLLNHSFRKERTLVGSMSIDVSPSIDASGDKMVFTSSRQGNPHIFMLDTKTKEVKRLSTGGKYNTDPSISPDGTMVVYARQMGDGHRLFLYDLRTGEDRQLSFGPGSDEQPEFAPDSYFIAFRSTRAGQSRVYLTTRHGGHPILVDTGSGDAAFPSWGLKK